MSRAGAWRFYVDRGGTFTDVVAEAPDGPLSSLKLLSPGPALRRCRAGRHSPLPGTARQCAHPAERVAELRMGTTVATNALLERKGERVLLVTTRGLKDQLRIGYQNRPKLFALKIERPDMLYADVLEADERVTRRRRGAACRWTKRSSSRISRRRARRGSQPAPSSSCMAIAIPRMNAVPPTSRDAAGFTQISTSHETVPLMKFVSRGDTTVADAYLSPVLARYANRIARALGERPRLFFMTSNGGLAAPRFFRGKDAILSGPAGGVVGMAETAREAGFDHVIGFDMGGTSTDVSRFDGTLRTRL